MVKGIGVDLIKIERIAQLLEKDSRFPERLFSPEEIAYCQGKFRKEQHYAARFTAKEAFMKAMGTGYREGIGWKEISVRHDALGKPYIELSGKALEMFRSRQLTRILLSISHSHEYAVSMVVLE